jgi:serine/threonine protein kinase
MGVVYLAHQMVPERNVALKVMSSELAEDATYRERFTREASLLAKLNSPHVIQIYAYGQHADRLYLATQLVEGEDLAKWSAARGRCDIPQACELLAQVALALDAAHEMGVIHRDIKPQNILVGTQARRPYAYLCDFGIAQARGEQFTTTVGAFVGTLPYTAPERFHGGDASVESDIYALGCVLWQLLAGAPPYSGDPVEVMNRHLTGPIPNVPGVTPSEQAVNLILSRALAKRPEDRYHTAEDMQVALDAVARGATGSSGSSSAERPYRPPPGPPEPTPSRPSVSGDRFPPPGVPATTPPRSAFVLLPHSGHVVTWVARLVLLYLVGATSDAFDKHSALAVPLALIVGMIAIGWLLLAYRKRQDRARAMALTHELQRGRLPAADPNGLPSQLRLPGDRCLVAGCSTELTTWVGSLSLLETQYFRQWSSPLLRGRRRKANRNWTGRQRGRLWITQQALFIHVPGTHGRWIRLVWSQVYSAWMEPDGIVLISAAWPGGPLKLRLAAPAWIFVLARATATGIIAPVGARDLARLRVPAGYVSPLSVRGWIAPPAS